MPAVAARILPPTKSTRAGARTTDVLLLLFFISFQAMALGIYGFGILLSVFGVLSCCMGHGVE
jgi:hypothetical protein